MESKDIKCKIHGYELEVYCPQDKEMICKACITAHAKQHHEIMFLTDYAEEVLAKKLENVDKTIKEGMPIIQKQTKTIDKELKDLRIDLEKFRSALAKMMLELENLIEIIGNGKPADNYEEILKMLNKRSEEIRAEFKTIKARNVKEIIQKIDDLDKTVISLLNFGDAFTPIRTEFKGLLKFAEKESVLLSLKNAIKLLLFVLSEKNNELPAIPKPIIDESWEFDQNAKNPNISLSNNNKTLRYESENSCEYTIFCYVEPRLQIRFLTIFCRGGSKPRRHCCSLLEKIKISVNNYKH